MSIDHREDAFHEIEEGQRFDRNAIDRIIQKAEALEVPIVQTPGMSNEYLNEITARQRYWRGE